MFLDLVDDDISSFDCVFVGIFRYIGESFTISAKYCKTLAWLEGGGESKDLKMYTYKIVSPVWNCFAI